MKNKITYFLIIILAITSTIFYINLNKKNDKPIVTIYPETIYPGDPIFITINASSSIKSILYDEKVLKIFNYNNYQNSIIPTDFYEKDLKHKVSVSLNNGMKIEKDIILLNREKVSKPLGIPEKLGGNTQTAGKALVNNLSNENSILNNIKSEAKILWVKPFIKPLDNMFVTDGYGYNRDTVGYSIVHKGTDFRASVGTPVYAMNDGIVKIKRNFTTYGNTIVIDHGDGLITLYMHLDKMNVNQGDYVKAHDIIGLSGQTGYASAPHLHISIKINGISIDPYIFMKFFGIFSDNK